jgi:hypothetical protein
VCNLHVQNMCGIYVQKLVHNSYVRNLHVIRMFRTLSVRCIWRNLHQSHVQNICVASIFRNFHRLYVRIYVVGSMSRNLCVAVCKNLNSGWINNPLLKKAATASAINFGLKVSVIVWTINHSSSDSAISKNKINCTERQNPVQWPLWIPASQVE